MKYGILTFHNIPNCGAVLQAYSLCRTIRELGVDCEILDYYNENIIKRELAFVREANPVKNIIKYLGEWQNKKARIRGCNNFIKNTGMLSEKVYDSSTICSAPEQYDGFISGSDMIWELPFTNGDDNYFLNFADNAKRKVSYASSAQTDWGESEDRIMDLLKKYDALSARESDIAERIRNHNLECKLVCDPTMLITPEEWLEFAGDCREKGYVLVCFPDKTSVKCARAYAREHGKKVLVVQDMRNSFYRYKRIKIKEPCEWIGYIKNADAIFTSSYHVALFSLYFNREFWISVRHNRIRSLLDKLGLEDRFIEQERYVNTPIDYKSVNQRIEGFRADSLRWLKSIVCQQNDGQTGTI